MSKAIHMLENKYWILQILNELYEECEYFINNFEWITGNNGDRESISIYLQIYLRKRIYPIMNDLKFIDKSIYKRVKPYFIYSFTPTLYFYKLVKNIESLKNEISREYYWRQK